MLSKSSTYHPLKYIFLFITFAFICFIFGNSLQVAEVSSQMSGGIVNAIIKVFANVGINIKPDDLTLIIRKGAHFSEFAFLGMMICLTFNSFKIELKLYWQSVILSGVFVALIDEFIQSFTSGRSSEIKDVFIDSAGVVAGLILFVFILAIKKNIQEKSLKKATQ